MLNSLTIKFPVSIILRLSVLLLLLVSSAVQAQTPRSPEDYFKRGVTRFNKGDYEGAIADYDRAVEINSGFIQAGGNDGRSWKSGGADGSIANNERITVIDPFNAAVYYYMNRGFTRLDLGQEMEAQKGFDRCLALNPGLRSEIDQYIKEKKPHAIKE